MGAQGWANQNIGDRPVEELVFIGNRKSDLGSDDGMTSCMPERKAIRDMCKFASPVAARNSNFERLGHRKYPIGR